MWTYKCSWPLSVIIWGKESKMSIVHSQMHLYLLRKKRLLSCGRELGYINTLVTVKHAPAYSMDWWTNTPLLTFPPLTVCPLLQQCLVTTGVLLRKAGCCRQQWQAGLAGSLSADCLLNRKHLQMSQTPCCGNTDTRSGSIGLMTICPQIRRIF